MKSEIKQRITQLNNGEIPDGYIKNDFGVFPCDWVTDRTFGDLFDFYGGLGKSRDELGDKGHAYLHYGDMHRGNFSIVSLERYSQLPKCDVVLKGNETYLMEDGDVAFLDASEDLDGTSRAVLIDNPDNRPFIAGLHIIYGKSKDASLEKWYKQYITSSENVRKQFQKLAVGFKVYGVNRDTLPRIKVAYPQTANEQSKIAEILMKWDEAIELYNRQIEKLKLLKSVCLKKMFPKKGEKVPEWRLSDFTDDWEQRKLGEVGKARSGVGFPDTEQGGAIGVPFFKVSDMNSDGNENEMTVANNYVTAEQIAAHRWLPIEELPAIFFAKVGAAVMLNRKRLCRFPFLLDNNTMAYSLNSTEWDADFAKALFETVDLTSLVQVGALPSYNAGDVEAMEISIPSLSEQGQIGAFFKQLNNLITLHQRKVESIEKQRKVLQQYLLNGIVRVK